MTTSASLTGTTILQYRIGHRLGSGGMGEVYVAEDTRLGRQVALKFLPEGHRRDEESRARLIREARAASVLRSPNIAVTYDFVEYDDTLFIAMEYVEGELISERIARGPLPIRDAVDVAAQAADALDEAHSHNIIHRDIKSANLIQTRRGLVKVLDFGLAKISVPDSIEARVRSTTELQVTIPGLVMGTISYMSPEQLRGGPIDQRVDLFSLGVVMYEMLAAKLPFTGETIVVTMDRILHEGPVPLAQLNAAVPAELAAIVDKTLQKDPAYRYQSARELHIDLHHVARRLEALTASGITRLPSLMSSGGVVAMPAPAGQRTIAILTFANVTREPADDWIGTGIAETVTADLKNLHNVGVIGRTQIFEALKNMAGVGSTADDRQAIEIGRRLSAGWVVFGAYQRLGDRIRITAQLVEVATGSLIRTVKIDGRVDEIFELQDRIVFELSRSLDVKLGSEEAAAIERDATQSIEAFEAYSRGVLNLRSAGREAIDRAIALFERALEIDPGYAAAWAAIGGAYNLKGGFLGLLELHHMAIERLRKALALDPSLVNARVWLGGSLLALGRLEEGVSALQAAASLEPGNADVHQSLARAYWMWRGMIPEGLAELRKAISLNPEGGYAYLQASLLEALSGDLDAAEASARQAIELQERAMSGTEGLLIVGAHARLGYVHYLRQQYDAGYAEYRRELEYLSTSDHALRERTLIELNQKLSALHQARGEDTEAERFGNIAIEAHQRRVSAGADDPATRYYVAAVFARRNDVANTMRHLSLPLTRLPQFTRWRVPRDIDFRPVLDQLTL